MLLTWTLLLLTTAVMVALATGLVVWVRTPRRAPRTVSRNALNAHLCDVG